MAVRNFSGRPSDKPLPSWQHRSVFPSGAAPEAEPIESEETPLIDIPEDEFVFEQDFEEQDL